MTEVSARRAATRDRLVEAAMTTFAERGVLGSSVEEICELAGFTRGAFYSNFTSKDDLCIAVLERHYELQTRAMETAVASVATLTRSGTLDDLIPAAIEVFFAAQGDDRRWVLAAQELRLHAARAPEMAAAYREFHHRGTLAVARVIEDAVASLGCELVTTGPETIGVLHAVHDYGTLGALIGTDPIDGDIQGRLLTEVLRALIRPRAPFAP